LEGYLKENHGGQIIVGGQVFMENNFIQPTIVADPNPKSSLMTEEIFGPILPVVGYDELDYLINLINTKPKPLVVYCFSNDKTVRDRLSRETSSGAFVVNDVVVQLLNTDLPFGGVGQSGSGRYHGRSGFLACSNLKSCM
jgi:aldehyde dehydrogenase (NAD+)